MPHKQPDHFGLRYRIMKYVYEMFVEYPNAALDIRLIEESCDTNPKQLNWNLAYLEKCGYIELGRSVDFPPYVCSAVTITAKGIDLVENETVFENRFKKKSKLT